MPATPIVVLDSNEYIFGIARVDPNCEALLHRLSGVKWRDKVQVVTPRIVEREDAIIAAVVEWSGAGVLVSENRHFLEELETEAFEVVDAAEFLEMLQ